MAALVLQNNSLVRVESVDGPVHARVRQRLAEARAAGRPFVEQAALTPQIRTPAMTEVYYRTYATKDAAIALACVSPGLQRALMKAVGLADEAHQNPLGDREAQARHYAGLRARMEAVIASRTTAEWKAVFDADGIPAAGVKLSLELFDDEQALANGLLHDLPHPALGPVRVLSTPVGMDGPGFRSSPATAPFGSECRAILNDLGFSKEEIERFLTEGVTREQLA
jgi:formyl-CoA transferase